MQGELDYFMENHPFKDKLDNRELANLRPYEFFSEKLGVTNKYMPCFSNG